MNEIRTICKRLLSTKATISANRNPIKKLPEKKESTKPSIRNIKHFPRVPVKQNYNALRPFKVSVEGNIGAGKTTVINNFSQFSEVETYAEPINWWRNLEGYNLLDLLYKDINKWYNVFQKYVQLTRVQVQTMPPKYSSTTTQIFERSLQNNRFTFVEQAYAAGYLKPPEYEVLKQWYQWVKENIDIDIDYIVYLRTSPEVVFERIKSRGRLEETSIPFDYIKELHDFHEKWLLSDDSQINKDQLLVIDANNSLDLVLNQCEINKNKVIRSAMVQRSAGYKLF